VLGRIRERLAWDGFDGLFSILFYFLCMLWKVSFSFIAYLSVPPLFCTAIISLPNYPLFGGTGDPSRAYKPSCPLCPPGKIPKSR
jgi:hypothetical protein